MRHRRNARAVRDVADDVDRVLACQLLVAADVIPVVVRAPDSAKSDPLTPDGFAHRAGFGGVDDRRVAALGDDEVRVVVLEARDGNDSHWDSIFPSPFAKRGLLRG